jgi:hypothetical protein
MNEFSSKFNIEEKIIDFPKLTFEELSKENVSIEQLYLWSAPIDLIENYQFYLNKFDLSLSKEIFYNCTLPRFGPRCQYQFYSNNLSLSELIHQYYIRNESNPNSLTCYEHLKCSSSSCLDWTEICDGKIDCVDDGLDEEHCWKVEVNQCNDNEYRCLYGQCIPKIFYQDGQNIFDCIDASDETLFRFDITNLCHKNEPRFGCEDRICKGEPLTSSCVNKRESLLMKSMFYMKDNSISEQCWFLIKCMFNRLDSEESFCRELYAEDLRLKSFLNTCPEMLYIANYPILFDDTYITIKKIQLEQMINNQNFNFSVFLSYGRDNIPIIEKDSNVIDYIYGIPNKFHIALNCSSLICNRSSMYQCINSSKCI